MVKEIELTQGKVAMVDDADYEWLNQWKWCSNGSGYAIRGEGPRTSRYYIRMHRLIMNAPEGLQVDHINGIRHHNRRENLRIVNNTQNQMNRGRDNREMKSKFEGVCTQNSRYVKKREKFGEFARLNFPEH